MRFLGWQGFLYLPLTQSAFTVPKVTAYVLVSTSSGYEPFVRRAARFLLAISVSTRLVSSRARKGLTM